MITPEMYAKVATQLEVCKLHLLKIADLKTHENLIPETAIMIAREALGLVGEDMS